jgi:hypothetical protein
MIPGIVASVTIHNKNNNQFTQSGEINYHRNSIKAQRTVVNDMTNYISKDKDTASSKLVLMY